MAAVLTGVEAGAAGASPRTVRPEFSGSAAEYFRIWVVNLLFSLVTLGIYSAWAKVRKKRYFYGSTRLDGDSFDYFASPKAILKGRILAAVVFAAYALLGQLFPHSAYLFWLAAFLLLPWIVVRAFSFNARNSAWRGLRFDFTATSGQSARVYMGMLLLVVISGGLAFPWFMARMKSFVVSHHALGTTRLECAIPAKAFYGIYIRAGLMLFGLAVPTILLTVFGLRTLGLSEELAWLAVLVPALVIYLIYALVFAYTQARTGNLLWNSARGPGLRFESTLSARRLAKLYVGNIVALICSAGLLIPWAVVRTLRYRLECLAVHIDAEAVHQANPELGRVGAASQELGDVFNLDLGL
jgi:uncharacterized membrane protein YjgN (DUF898 family)